MKALQAAVVLGGESYVANGDARVDSGGNGDLKILGQKGKKVEATGLGVMAVMRRLREVMAAKAGAAGRRWRVWEGDGGGRVEGEGSELGNRSVPTRLGWAGGG